ncbi:hypothetical protein [Streptacidiphilus sp. MAP5-3]|uniref:hypothetical protein n=1 Tax=unclassified Streptacidiphilus TaxID=2643834 RepID=UPI0035124548
MDSRSPGRSTRDQQEPESPRNPLLDPRLAGAGGMLVAAAAIAWLLTHGTGGNPSGPAPLPPPSATAVVTG